MSPYLIPPEHDRLGRADRPLTVVADGVEVTGVHGQTLATVLLAAGRTHWRSARDGGGRGVFCGIGVCFDCVATVNGVPDVRLCRRPARDGDIIIGQSRTDRDGRDSDTDSGRARTDRDDHNSDTHRGRGRIDRSAR